MSDPAVTPPAAAPAPNPLTFGEDPGAAPAGAAGTPAPVTTSATPRPTGNALSDLDLPTQIREAYKARQMDETGHGHAKVARRFIEWLQDRSLTLESMPADAVETYLGGFDNPVTRNVAASAIRVLFDVCQQVGHKYVQQPVNRVKGPPRKKAVDGLTGQAAAPTAPGVAAAHLPFVTGSPAQTVQAAAAMAPMESMPSLVQQRPAVQARPRTALPGLGGRIRVSKRLDGSEGIPMPIGSRVLVGEYSQPDLDGEDSIARFIANYIRPKYGPWAGGRPAVYIVERLDNVGNPIPGGAMDVPIMPGEEPAPGTPAPLPAAAPQVPVNVQPAQPAQPPASDKFLDYLMGREKEANVRYESLLSELREQKKTGAMDATTFMLLAEKFKPEKIDVAAAAQAFRRNDPPPPPPRVEPTPPPPFGGYNGPGFGGGLGGFDPFGPPPAAKPDPSIDRLATMVEKLVERQSAPPPAQDPIATFTALLGAMKAMQPPPPPPDPIKDALVQTALNQIGKTKTLAETLADLRAVQQFMGGNEEGRGPSLGEVGMALIENLDKVGDLVGKMRMGMAPPAIPSRPVSAPPQAAAAPAKAPVPPLPVPAREAFVALRDLTPDKEQEIVATIWNLLTTLAQAPDPWPLVTKRATEAFLAADSKSEIRALVTQLYVWCGAKPVMTDAIVEKIVTVLHTHYSLIYGQMTGGQTKTLADAGGATPPAAADALTPREAAAEEPPGPPDGRLEVEEVGEEEEEEEEEEEDDEFAATPTGARS